MFIDLGDVVALAVTIRDSSGDPADAGSVACTVTLPDATAVSVPVAKVDTGVYTISYTPTAEGLHGVRWVATGANASSYRDSFTVLSGSIPLVSLAEAKARLNITGTDHDEELRRIVAAAAGRAAREANRDLTALEGADLAVAQQATLELVSHLWETQRTPIGRNAAMQGPTPGMGYALPNRVAEMLAPLVVLDGFA